MRTWKPLLQGLLGTFAVAFLLPGAPARAQELGMSLDQAVFVTCREAQAMPSESRVAFTLALVERAAAAYGVSYVQGSALDNDIATMLRAGCTVYPNAYLLTTASMAVRRAANLPPLGTAVATPVPFETAAFLTCHQYALMSKVQQDDLQFALAVTAGNHYGYRFENTPSERAKLSEGLTPLVQGTCRLVPDFSIYGIVARAVAAAAGKDS